MVELLVAERLALLATGSFFGASLYVSVVEHPARLQAGMDAGLRQFLPSAHRAGRLQASAAIIGTLSALASWLLGADSSWAFSGAVLFLAVPITLIAILPIVKRLHDPQLQPNDPEARRLFERWGKLHSLRTIAGFLAFTMQIAASIRR